MTETDLTNKTTEPKVISGELLGDKLDEVETNKQDKLVAGDNISIIDNTISASGGNLDDYYTKTETEAKINEIMFNSLGGES